MRESSGNGPNQIGKLNTANEIKTRKNTLIHWRSEEGAPKSRVSNTIQGIFCWHWVNRCQNLNAGGIMFVQSFPYENHCEFYKKLASRSWHVLFRLTDFFLLHNSSFLRQNKSQTTIQLNISMLRDCSSVRIGFMLISIIIVLLRVKRSTWYLCLNFKMSKFTLQLNKSY